MSDATNKPPITHFRAADIRGFTQLAVQAVSGVTQIVEGVHQSVLQTIGVSRRKVSGETDGLTGFIYRTIYATTRLTGKALDLSLEKLLPKQDQAPEKQANSPQREILLSVLNGVMGDRLAEDNSSFALSMTMRYQNEPINLSSISSLSPSLSRASDKLLIMVHGLCLSDRQWHSQQSNRGVAHGEVLASRFGYSPIYLRYNTGLPISQNGRELCRQLEVLTKAWPVPVTEVSILTHSMGGLVARSAVYCAQVDNLTWSGKLKNLIFLGTPHHGAPLERLGHWIDTVLGKTPFTAPFSKLGRLRSAGITDLRHGYISQHDKQQHKIIPLPDSVNCYTIAATTASKPETKSQTLIGDGLVPVNSALGISESSDLSLKFKAENQWIVYQANHMALLSSLEVNAQLQDWLLLNESCHSDTA